MKMPTLDRKIDFAVVFSAKGANPNGDPLNGNRPRTTLDGLGELSDVCLKRKIRDRLLEKGHAIFVQSDDNKIDDYGSLRERAEAILKDAMTDRQALRRKACETWIDVRAFGQLFAYKGVGKKRDGVSEGIKGPVTIQSAFSVAPVSVSSIQITKSVSGEGDGSKRASDTMGMKHRVDHGLYLTYGSMNPSLAEKTGFSCEDAYAIKAVLPRLFENDASSARPEGSMEVVAVYWWEHDSKGGRFSSAKVHRSLRVEPKADQPAGVEDYDIVLEPLEGLEPEVLPGF
jgi:CRISPR-associated protein Csd2